MQQRWRNFLVLSGGAGMLIGVALILSGALPFLPDGLRVALNLLKNTASLASPYWYNTIGSSYAPYPGQTSCIAGTGGECTYNCQGNPIYGAIDLQKTDNSVGLTGYVYQNGATGSGGTAPTVTSPSDSILLDYSCTPGRSRANQHTESRWVSCGKIACQEWGCYPDPTTYETFNTSLTVTDPNNNVIITDSSSLYGSPTIQPAAGPPGTYSDGQTLQYALNCSGVATPAVASVTVVSSVVPTISANPTTVRAGYDTSTLTINASSMVAGSCNLLAPDGSTVKTYSGDSITNDQVTVGPFGNATPQAYTIKCIGALSGFNVSRSASITVNLPPILSLTANNTPYSLLIPPSSSADIRWTSSNQLPNSCSVTYTAVGGSCITAAKTISTSGAYNWKTFTIGADIYLAAANAYSGATYSLDSNIYKWVPSLSCFGKDGSSSCGTSYQSIATNGAAKWESFIIGGNTYLAVANSRNDTTRTVDSKIYKWLSAQACFGNGTTCGTAYQSIETSGAVDIKPITVGADTYLAVANYRDDTNYSINSNIYKWLSAEACFGSGTTCGTVLQAIPTKGAYRMESFTLDGGSYLAVSNSYAPAITLGYNQPSYIYKYIASGSNCPAGGGFGNAEYGSCGTPMQAIDTSGAYGFKFFAVGNVSYLAVANAYNGTSFNINSKIYQWMSVSKCFGNGTTCGAAFQALATNGATQLQTFTTGPDLYLIAANAYNGSSYNINSSFYQWMTGSQCFGNGSVCGTALQSIPTSGTAWWEPVTISGDIYLATANYYNGSSRNINSSIMKWSPSGCGDEELGTPTTWTGDQSPSPNGYQTGIFSGSRLYTLACKWLDGTTASSTSVRVTTQTELMLSANGSSTPTVYITPDTSALIQWSSKGVQQNSCHVTNTADSSDWAADNNPTGYSSPVLADGQSVTYTFACVDIVGAAVSKVMTVTAATPLPGTSDLSISVKRVVRGGRPTVSWSAINLNPGISCSVTPALQSGVPEWDGTGTSWSSPVGGALGPIINVTTTFTLACFNKAGNSASVFATAYLVPAFKEL